LDAINGADTTWILVSSALVMLMTPALGFFYGGLVRQKNALSTIMHSFFMLAFVSILWAVIGYSLAFGPSLGGFIGSLAWVGLNGVGLEPNTDYAGTIPHQAFMIYQMMFAVITPALISGAFAERKRFKAFIIFSALWPTGSGLWAAGSAGWAPSTSPAAPWSTSPRASRPWSAPWCSASAPATAASRWSPITRPTPSWARRCSGSAGSASTPAAPWARAPWPSRPS
jgi:hypothetical protein